MLLWSASYLTFNCGYSILLSYIEQLFRFAEQQWVTEVEVNRILDELNVTELQPQIVLLTQLMELVREIPDEFFTETEQKTTLLTVVQEVLDEKIEIEEEGEDEDGEWDDDDDFDF